MSTHIDMVKPIYLCNIGLVCSLPLDLAKNNYNDFSSTFGGVGPQNIYTSSLRNYMYGPTQPVYGPPVEPNPVFGTPYTFAANRVDRSNVEYDLIRKTYMRASELSVHMARISMRLNHIEEKLNGASNLDKAPNTTAKQDDLHFQVN